MSDREIGDAFWKRPHARIGQFQIYKEGWEAAMRFMSQPRIPAAPSTGTPLPVGPSTGDAPKEHSPHGLVAFYTDAPNG